MILVSNKTPKTESLVVSTLKRLLEGATEERTRLLNLLLSKDIAAFSTLQAVSSNKVPPVGYVDTSDEAEALLEEEQRRLARNDAGNDPEAQRIIDELFGSDSDAPTYLWTTPNTES